MNSDLPTTVLHIIDKLSMDGVNPSSCAILLCEWYQHIDPEQFRISVCSLRKSDPGGKLLERNGVQVNYLGFGKYSFRNLKGITSLIEKQNADILHLHGYSSANFGRIASRRKGIINIVHEHAVLRVNYFQYLADLLLRKYTDTAVAVSGNVKDFMTNARSIPPSKIQVIGNGIKLSKFRKSEQSIIRIKRSELGVPEGCRIVGTVTRLREEKGNEYFLRSMPHVLKEFANIVFLIVGDGPLRDSLESLARELGLLPHVRFLGFRSDVVEILSLFDINVIASLSEGFPLSLVEAMSIGNPIVATEVGGMKEVAEGGKTVLFVPPKDPVAISDKVKLLLEKPYISERLSRLAREASKEFSIEKSVALLTEFYFQLKPSKTPRR